MTASPTSSAADDQSEPVTPSVSESHTDMDAVATIQPITGAWTELADGPPAPDAPGALAKIARLPPDFQGLATPGMNPMSMTLSHEEICIGTACGDIYVMSFVGWLHRMKGESGSPSESDYDSVDREGSGSELEGEY